MMMRSALLLVLLGGVAVLVACGEYKPAAEPRHYMPPPPVNMADAAAPTPPDPSSPALQPGDVQL